MARATWVDLLDPDRAELEGHLPKTLQQSAIDRLLAAAEHDDEPRPTLQTHGDYVFGVFLVAVAVPEEDRVFYQEIDVVLTREFLLTVRKTPPGEEPYDIGPVRTICPEGEEPESGMILYHLVDDVAERYLNLIDAVNDEIDELEDNVEKWANEKVRQRLSDLRHDLLHIRRTLAPTRDAVRRIVDGRLELEAGVEAFPRGVELHFADAYDKLLRASEGLELSRDLVASARDYHQSKISNDQNEVMKKLTAIASILLVPTFIVGLYGQNFKHIPELHWSFGYWWSWGWILASTAFQLVYFRRKGWI
ncbi:MAG TPA: magnesium transporter CorA family protein [Gaiellaceae bacterium]|nr:magnesium transporter CorA family protein [Gaiellaceae bacterium]